MRRPRPEVTLALVTLLTAVSACAGGPADDGSGATGAPEVARLRVGVSLYPLEEIVRRVGGDLVDIVHITPPGVNSHDVELSAKTLDQLTTSDVVLYLGDGFQPRVEDALEQLPDSVRVVDMLDVDGLSTPTGAGGDDGSHEHHQHGDVDPHVWLDPANMVVMTRAVAEILADEMGGVSGAGSEATIDDIASAADAYVAELTALDGEVDAGLGVCGATTVVTSHEAFGHLFARLGLESVSITGLDPAEQPSAQQLGDIADVARRAGVTTIFVDASVSTGFAEALAAEIGATVAVLDPLESLSTDAIEDGVTYLSRQRDNLRALAEGMGCR